MGSEDQALTVHSEKRRKNFHHPKGKHSHQKGNSRKPNSDLSNLKCFTCDERGHYARDCPRKKKIVTRRREIKEDIMLMLQRI